MANETDLRQSLLYCDKVLKRKDLDPRARIEWEKGKRRLNNKIKNLNKEPTI